MASDDEEKKTDKSRGSKKSKKTPISKEERARLKAEYKALLEKKNTPLIKPGTLIQNRFEVVELIGGGGYGQILKAKDTKRDVSCDPVAVKILIDEQEPQRMILEMKVLCRFRGHAQIPKVYASGKFDKYMFIVMEILGKNLSDLRKAYKNKRFCVSTTVRVGLQMLTPLKAMHDAHWVHRDIKPANMCIGCKSETCKVIYLVDFGIARELKAGKDGKLRMRKTVGFRGTMRYASVNVHDKKDQTASDDLVSLVYSIIELGEGQLPWTKARDKAEVTDLKHKIGPDTKLDYLPEGVLELYAAVMDNPEPHKPDYAAVEAILKKCLEGEDESPFEWEALVGSNRKDQKSSVKTHKKAGSKREENTAEHDMLM